ncbi:phage major capsid protein [Streptomyces sp. NBC_00237]|uniref:phage major capsid protein n=1 Tax=Streptomyces sp. NBC_00237 TaxID=2975687 RepID=UPI00224ED360|nr:phage major capsid protein [Streptomyces sp. NBC_00237]MCX5203007.1 phage major capsid protein [Streptomyces sp. NBC_00237]
MATVPANTQNRQGELSELTFEQRLAKILHDQITTGSSFLSAFDTETISAQSMKVLVGTGEGRAAVVGELDEIPVGKDDVSEVDVEPVKYGKMRVLSSELIDDSNPNAISRATAKLAGEIYRGIDDDFLNAPTQTDKNKKACTGILQGLTAKGEVKDNLDAVMDAKAEIADAEGSASLFIVHPLSAAEMRKTKVKLADKTEGNTYLLSGNDFADGLTVIESKFMPQGKALIADRTAVTAVIRKTMDIKTDASRYFENDAVAVRGLFRAAWIITAKDKMRLITVPKKKADEAK